MLLNQSRPRPPRISQHRQGAGDLQIKRSHYLRPAARRPRHPFLLSASLHMRGPQKGIRCDGRHQSFLLRRLWDWRRMRRRGALFCPHSSLGSFSAGIMWSAASDPPELPSGPSLPFINKIGGSERGWRRGRSSLEQLRRAAAFLQEDHYGGLGILRAPDQIGYEIWAAWRKLF